MRGELATDENSEQGDRANQFRRVPEPGLLEAEDLGTLGSGLRAAMDALYTACVLVAGSALVLISAVIPYGVFTRYVLNSAASFEVAVGGEGLKHFRVDPPTAATQLIDE